MKYLKTIMFVVFVILSSSNNLYALTDAEVNQLRAIDNGFASADNRLNNTWNNLDHRFKDIIRDEQIEWVKTIRDRESQEFIDLGLSKAEAYTLVTNARSKYLIESNKEYTEILLFADEDKQDDIDNQIIFQSDQYNNPFLGTWALNFNDGQISEMSRATNSSAYFIFTENEMITLVKSPQGDMQERRNVIYKLNHPDYYLCDQNGQKCTQIIFENKDLIKYPLSPVQTVILTRVE